jgi:hypothetical protein
VARTSRQLVVELNPLSGRRPMQTGTANANRDRG